MIYQVIQVVDRYDWRGRISQTNRTVVFSHKDVIKTVRYRYTQAEYGCYVTVNEHASVRFETNRIGYVGHDCHDLIDFGEIYRIVEGDAAYLAVLNGEAEAVSEKAWLATKS